MLEDAILILVEGILSGIGIGFIFYLYPVVRHTYSNKYRYKFRFEDDGKLRFRNKTKKYLKIGFFIDSLMDLSRAPLLNLRVHKTEYKIFYWTYLNLKI